jgi:death-on-curing protein
MRWLSGLRDLGLLEASLAQPQQSFAGVDPYPGLTAKAAALGFSLIQNHPFMDGEQAHRPCRHRDHLGAQWI